MVAEISEKTSDAGPSKPASSRSGSGDEAATAKGKGAATKDLTDIEKADSTVVVPPSKLSDDDLFKHLPPDEAEVLKRQVLTPTVKVGFITLYRYASTYDLLIMAVSAVCAIASGAALPLMTVIFGTLQG